MEQNPSNYNLPDISVEQEQEDLSKPEEKQKKNNSLSLN